MLDGRTVHHGQGGTSPGPALLLRLQPGHLLCHQAVAVPIAREDLCVRGAERVHHWGMVGREQGINMCPRMGRKRQQG